MSKVKSEHIDWSKYTSFQQKVYRCIMKIKPGQVLTYAQVARLIGNPKSARAVGNALATNQDAPIIPCHRVIKTDGGLGGYSGRGGVKGKIKLLRAEGYQV